MKIYPEEEQKRVKLIRMEDPYTKLVDGDEGTIVGEDDAGHILVRWDRGSSLSLIPDVDEYEILEKKTFRLIRFNQFVVLESTYQSKWSSSLKKEQIVDLLPKIYQVQTYILDSKTDYVNKVESILEPYDRIVRDFLVELFTINYWQSEENEELIDIIIDLGDKVMTKFGTEPRQVLNAIENVISYFSRFLPEEDILEEKVKAQRYKGKKIPGKYLTKNPSKMKKEIDTYRGKKEYKKDWDADYKSGKGGVGKRVKTKKSAATKAYQRMFGNKEK
jgi:hypothetical protein